MNKLPPISLPNNPPSDYLARLNVMLYQHLRRMTSEINALMDEVQMRDYATRYDQDSSTPTYAYLGKAQVGEATSSPVWQIQKLAFGTDGDVTITWADGNSAFDNVWDNRASLSYS